MLNEFWSTASASYKAVVFGAMGMIALGIVLNISGQMSQSMTLTYASLAFIGVGLVLHSAGVVIRGAKVQKRLRNDKG